MMHGQKNIKTELCSTVYFLVYRLCASRLDVRGMSGK